MSSGGAREGAGRKKFLSAKKFTVKVDEVVYNSVKEKGLNITKLVREFLKEVSK